MTFQYNPPDGYRNVTSFPTKPANETAFRDSMMTLFDQVSDELNSGANSAAGVFGVSRQSVMNGNFDVWQRGLIANNPLHGTYLADRFQTLISNTGTLPTIITHSQGTFLGGELPLSLYYYRINPNGAGSGFGINDFYQLRQSIENGTRYLCGNGEKVTLSFYARSQVTPKKIGIYLAQAYGTGGSPSAAEALTGTTFSLTSSWEKYTFTFTTNNLTGKTFGSNHDDNLSVNFALMWGSTYGARFGSATAENFGGSGIIDIAQIQLNAGDAAMPFQPLGVDAETAQCARYFQKRSTNTVNQFDLSPPMRINPTITGSGPYNYDAEF